MNRRKLRSINISLLGGHSGVSGKYELGIDSIRMVNEEDVKYPLVGAYISLLEPSCYSFFSQPTKIMRKQVIRVIRIGRTSIDEAEHSID